MGSGAEIHTQTDTQVGVVHQAEIPEPQDTTTQQLPFPFSDRPAYSDPAKLDSSGLFLRNPSNLKREVVYDPVSGKYVFYEKIGNLNYRL
ncbi:MAG TPA: hypothetical protein DCY25_03455, partial [Bacteroidales bacterium]|nr:hypothetical protein [Bacteroidales bacterium]